MAYHEFDAKVDEFLPLRDVVFKKLRRAILLEELKAGERLTEIHLADKLGVDPLVLMSGDIEPEQRQTALLLLDTIQAVSVLPQAKRLRFAEQFMELVQLLGEEALV